MRPLWLTLAAIWELARYDVLLATWGFAAAYGRLGIVREPSCGYGSIDELKRAIERALLIYPKQARCLQRSSASVRLLRKHGWNAELIIGCRPKPFASHAWVELDGVVFNDSAAYRRSFIELDRQ